MCAVLQYNSTSLTDSDALRRSVKDISEEHVNNCFYIALLVYVVYTDTTFSLLHFYRFFPCVLKRILSPHIKCFVSSIYLEIIC